MDKISPKYSLNDPIFLVKICISSESCENLTDETIYYRCRMTFGFLCRWRWYFEYLQAIVKVANPKRMVDIYFARMDPSMLLGNDFIEHRRAQLIRNRTKKIDKLVSTPFNDDLFGFTSQDRNLEIQKLRNDLEALERGEVTFPVLEDYINNIKKWIK